MKDKNTSPETAPTAAGNNNIVITIGRSFGSGGRVLGRKLADAFGFSFYDQELLSEAS